MAVEGHMLLAKITHLMIHFMTIITVTKKHIMIIIHIINIQIHVVIVVEQVLLGKIISISWHFFWKHYLTITLYRCNICHRAGRIQCHCCKGSGKLKWFLQLTVSFKNNEDDFLKKSNVIPDDLIRKCQAHNAFSEQNIRVIFI